MPQPPGDADSRRLDGCSLTLVVPAHNEQEIIERSLRRFLGIGRGFVADQLIDRFMVVVVDDGSADDTLDILCTMAEAEPEVVIVALEQNGGLGTALRAGFDRADTTHVVYTDADEPFDLTTIAPILRDLRNSPNTVYRAVRSSRRGSGPRRWAYSVGYQLLVRAAFGHDFYDVNFAGKIMPTAAVRGLGLQSRGSFIDAEMLARLAARNHRIETFEVEFQPRVGGESTLSSPAVIRHMLSELFRLRRSIRHPEPPSPADQ